MFIHLSKMVIRAKTITRVHYITENDQEECTVWLKTMDEPIHVYGDDVKLLRDSLIEITKLKIGR